MPAMAISTGEMAPDFELKTYDGTPVKLSELKGKTVVLEWFNRGCPFVQKHYNSSHMQMLQNTYTEKGVVWLIINSTGKSNRDFLSEEDAKELQDKWKIKSARMLVDADGTVGHLYGAKATPHMFVVNAEGRLVYQGAIDDNPDIGNDPATANNYVAKALDSILENKEISTATTKAYGCSVKYEG